MQGHMHGSLIDNRVFRRLLLVALALLVMLGNTVGAPRQMTLDSRAQAVSLTPSQGEITE